MARGVVSVAGGMLALTWSLLSHAALTCEQLFAITQSAVRYRDQGYSLDQVLGGLKGVDAEGKLTAAELDVLRRSITIVYMSQATPEEVALECVRARGAAKP